MKRNLLYTVFAATLLVGSMFVSGCAYTPAGFTDSTSLLDPAEVRAGPIVNGSSAYFNLFGIPLGHPDYAGAIADALRQHPGAKGLVEARAWFKNTFILVGTISTLYVEGKVALPADAEPEAGQGR